MIIRPIKFKDIPIMQSLITQLGYPCTVEQVQSRFERLFTLRDYQTFVAEKDEVVVGMVGFSKQFAYEFDGPYVRVQALVVDGNNRNQGIAEKLMAAVEEWAKTEKCVAISLNSGNREERVPAHQFYKKLGFVGKSTGFSKTLSR
jgi:GNAT superfamily N-acetyltransferase